MSFHRWSASALVLASTTLACGGNEGGGGQVVPLDELPQKNDVTSAPPAGDADGQRLTVEATAWLDAMPGAASPQIMVSTRIESTRRPEVSLERLYVVHGREVWTTGFDEVRDYDDHTLEGVVRHGPTWEGGDPVDVVVAVRTPSGALQYLRRSGLAITVAQ